MKKIIIFLFAIFCWSVANAQTDSTVSKLQISVYADVYYGYDFGKSKNHERPSFLYNHNRTSEVNLNLGFIKATYTDDRVRATLALMAGTYAQYNLAAEQGLLKNVYEANVGLKLNRKHNVWLDAGIFTSHIGFESAVSKDCWTLTRSLVAENSPYYESGAKLSYTDKNDKLTLVALVLNGWQRIRRLEGNSTPAFGTQILYKPNKDFVFNYSTYLGNENTDSLKRWRFYNNIYFITKLTNKLSLISGFDLGLQETGDAVSSPFLWYSPTGILRYQFNEKYAMAGRVEYYDDPNQVIIATTSTNGFNCKGYSVNFDYAPSKLLAWRIEGRLLESTNKIFNRNQSSVNQNFSIVTSLAFSL